MTGLLLLLLLLLGLAPAPPLETVLARKKGQRRVLLLYTNDRNNPELRAQLRRLAPHQPDLTERDLDVLVVCEPQLSGPDRTYLHGPSGLLRAEAPFVGLLIGKDGGVKKRFLRPVYPADLFALIDTMPMRKAERSHRPR